MFGSTKSLSWLTKIIEKFLSSALSESSKRAASAKASPNRQQPASGYQANGRIANEMASNRPPADAISAPSDDATEDHSDEEIKKPVPGGETAMNIDQAEISILIPEFKGDRDAGFTNRVIETLKTAKMLSILNTEVSLNAPKDNSSVPKLVAFQSEARVLLEENNADLMIHGEVLRNGLLLRMISIVIPPEGRPDEFGFSDALLIPHNFGADLANLIYASVLAAALPAKFKHRETLAPYLIGAAQQSMKLLETMPDGLDVEQIGSVYTFLGVTSACMWRLQNKSAGLTAAVTAYEKATREGPKELAPLVMAELKIRLGVALQELSTLKDDTDMFEDALDAFETVTSALNPNNYAREWGLAYICLGMAFLARGNKEVAVDDCDRASSAFDAALKVFTKEKDLKRWLEVMTLKGTALMTAGTINIGVRELQEAAEVLREVLAARDRVTQPSMWAQASNGLGSAVFALAKRTQDKTNLNEAIACFDGALSVYEELRQTVAIGIVRKNQQRAYRLRETMAG
jgi:tetratricopeptide (TPR) repeat protein